MELNSKEKNGSSVNPSFVNHAFDSTDVVVAVSNPQNIFKCIDKLHTSQILCYNSQIQTFSDTHIFTKFLK